MAGLTSQGKSVRVEDGHREASSRSAECARHERRAHVGRNGARIRVCYILLHGGL